MNIIHGNPPNIEEIKAVFPIDESSIFTYGNDIYVPSGVALDTPLIAHESVHARQQHEQGIDAWWKRYLGDRPFRASQEVEAYQMQYREAKKIITDRNQLSNFAIRLSKCLCSELYGNVLTSAEALKAIKSEQLIHFQI